MTSAERFVPEKKSVRLGKARPRMPENSPYATWSIWRIVSEGRLKCNSSSYKICKSNLLLRDSHASKSDRVISNRASHDSGTVVAGEVLVRGRDESIVYNKGRLEVAGPLCRRRCAVIAGSCDQYVCAASIVEWMVMFP